MRKIALMVNGLLLGLTFVVSSLCIASSGSTWSTPNYPNYYADDADISQTISVDGESMVLIINGETEAGYDFIDINGEKYSGEFKNLVIAVDSNHVNIRFTSDYSIQRQGVSVKAVSGKLWTTPNYPSSYDNLTGISGIISLPPNTESIKLTLMGETEKNYDYLQINGTKYHGQLDKLEVYILGNQVQIRFTSDHSVVRQGVAVLIEKIKPPLTEVTLKKHIQEHIQKDSNNRRRLNNSLGNAAGATAAAATINSICAYLGGFAAVDPEPGSKVIAAVADGTCWLIARGTAVAFGSYIIAKVSPHSDSTSPFKVESTETVHPFSYNDGRLKVTIIKIGNSYQLIRNSPFRYETYIIHPKDANYPDAQTLARYPYRYHYHESKRLTPKEQEALSKLKQYMQNEDRRIASDSCFVPDPYKTRRQAPEYYSDYCLPILPLVPVILQGNNGIINLAQNWPAFQINYHPLGPNDYGLYQLEYSGHIIALFTHVFSGLRINTFGLLFDTFINAFVLNGQTLNFATRYDIINISTLIQNPGHRELWRAYFQIRGATNIFAEELDNPNYHPMTTSQSINDYYWLTTHMIAGIQERNNRGLRVLESDQVRSLVQHFNNIYKLAQVDAQLTGRQLMVLYSIAELLNALPNLPTPIVVYIEDFMQNIFVTRIDEEDYPMNDIGVANTIELKIRIQNILEEVTSRQNHF